MSFNLQNVKFIWDDKFEGKELYASIFLNDLEEIVNRDDNLWKYKITKSDDKNYPFKSGNSRYFTFVYYEEEKFEKGEENQE